MDSSPKRALSKVLPLSEATIEQGAARIDAVCTTVTSNLAAVRDRLSGSQSSSLVPTASQRSYSELAIDYSELAIEQGSALALGLLDRTEAFLDLLLPPTEAELSRRRAAERGDAPEDRQQWAWCATVPRLLSVQVLRHFALRLSETATLRISVLCMRDQLGGMARRLRVRNPAQLLDRLPVEEAQRRSLQRQLCAGGTGDAGDAAGVAARAKLFAYLSCERLLGGGLAVRLFGQGAAALGAVVGTSATEPGSSEGSVEAEEEVTSAAQTQEQDEADSDLESCRKPGSALAGPPAPEQDLEGVATEFQLVVRNSFIEFLDDKPEEVPRPKSWSHSLFRDANRIAQSEPFTLRASWADPRHVVLSGSSSSSAPPPGLSPRCAGSPTKLTAEVLAAFNEAHYQPLPPAAPLPPPMEMTADPSAGSSSQQYYRRPLPDEEPKKVSIPMGAMHHLEDRTTVCFQNVPVDYSRGLLVSLLDDMGFNRRYSFVYVPRDFTRGIGLGYALVCMVTPADAQAVIDGFAAAKARGQDPSGFGCEASWSEPRQALEDHVERYRNSPVMHPSVPEEYKPLVFEQGVMVAFPPPTKSLRPPRIRHQKPK